MRPNRLHFSFRFLYFRVTVLKEFRTLLPYMKRYTLWYIAGVVFVVLTNGGQLYIPRLIGRAIDAISGGTATGSLILELVLLIAGMAVAVAVGRIGWRVFILGAARRIEKKFRDKLFSHLLSLSSKFYGTMKTGDIMARATNDMTNVRNAAGFALVSFIDGLFMTAAILIIMFSRYPRLALITILPTPVLSIIVLGVGKVLGLRFRRVQEGFSHLSEHVQEALSGIRVLKSFVQEGHSLSKFETFNDEYRSRNMGLVRVWGLFFPIIGFLSGLTSLLLLRFGGVAVIDGTLSPGEFVAFLAYLEMLAWPMMGAGYTVNLIQRGRASLGRINQILETEPEIQSPVDAVEKVESFDLEIRNLSFTYPDTEMQVLTDISLRVPEGSTLGILGRTGSGKSTLIRLLPRLLDAPKGTVFVGGRDVHEYDLAVLRSSIGMVPQDTFLFSATIRENIGFGNPDLPDEAIRAAAELSTIDRDVRELSKGLDTEVGERGVTLSGGQKQRAAISRAAVVDPPILVFDDALSAVDVETEERILGAFFEERRGKTNIIISHRVSTLQEADQIIVIEEGRITHQGSHQELISKGGLYREIYELQRAEQESLSEG